MAQGDRPAARIHQVQIDTQVLGRLQRYGREGLVDFHDLQLGGVITGLLQCAPDRIGRLGV